MTAIPQKLTISVPAGIKRLSLDVEFDQEPQRAFITTSGVEVGNVIPLRSRGYRAALSG